MSVHTSCKYKILTNRPASSFFKNHFVDSLDTLVEKEINDQETVPDEAKLKWWGSAPLIEC